MLSIDIPGWKKLVLEHLVLDFNGTLALDGELSPGVRERLTELSARLSIHVVTADTFGNVWEELEGIPCDLLIIPPQEQALSKANHLRNLGPDGCVAAGNGRNDALMLQEAALGIALLQEEGISPGTLAVADIVCRSIQDALDLLLHPLRLAATLRQ